VWRRLGRGEHVGKECRGEETKRATRDAYAALGIEDMLDKNFDVELARMTRLHVRRMEAERIEQDELDKRFEITEVQAATKVLVAGKASGVDDVLVEWLKYGKKQMTYALWLLCNLVWASEKPPRSGARGLSLYCTRMGTSVTRSTTEESRF